MGAAGPGPGPGPSLVRCYSGDRHKRGARLLPPAVGPPRAGSTSRGPSPPHPAAKRAARRLKDKIRLCLLKKYFTGKKFYAFRWTILQRNSLTVWHSCTVSYWQKCTALFTERPERLWLPGCGKNLFETLANVNKYTKAAQSKQSSRQLYTSSVGRDLR